MRLGIKTLLATIIVSFVTFSCSNYYLTTDSLRDQFSEIDSTRLESVTVRGPGGERYNYLANPIDIIRCYDKKGSPSQLANSTSIEMRVTETEYL